jgi:hypothetical protein
VPELARFYGIVIRMYFADHAPAHFHASYGSDEALVSIADGTVLAGNLPRRALALVLEWLELHRDELVASWDKASNLQPPGTIDPLP